jgi:hypothetical protein
MTPKIQGGRGDTSISLRGIVLSRMNLVAIEAPPAGVAASGEALELCDAVFEIIGAEKAATE